jgi:hypothetical protein
MKRSTRRLLRFGPAGLCAVAAALANNAAAQSQYFEPVSNGSTYSWDSANWTASGSANASPYTSNWTPGDFARFYNGVSDTYTVTVNASEQNTGLYNDSSGSTLTIADAGSGTGNLDVITAIQGFLAASGTTTYINAPITGNGGVAPELSGSIYLDAANTYTGGTALGDSGNTLTYFNNNSAFSSGAITLNRTGIGNFSTLLGIGGSTLTLANNFATVAANTGSGTALNFASAANTPVVSSGTWSLGTVNLNLRSSGGSTAPLTISGAISGSGNLVLSANGSGSVTILSGANTYTGTTTVVGSGGTYGGSGAITLQLGAANTIASSSSVILAGGTLSPGGFNHAMGSTTLGLTSSSTIDFTLGGTLSFADSSALTWSGVLDLVNYQQGDLQFDPGLTSAQLADIEFNGNASTLGTAYLDSNGYVVPEPSTVALSLLGGLGMMWAARRRKA